MLDAITTIIARIETIKTNTLPYKKKRLDLVLSALKEIVSTKNDFFHHELDNLTRYCQSLLEDRQFTYKQVSLFGTFDSRSKRVVTDLLKILQEQKLLIALEKIRIFYESQNDLSTKQILEQISLAVTKRDFALARLYDQSINKHSKSGYLLQTYDYIEKTLTHRCESLIKLPENASLYERVRTPNFEINKTQRVLYLEDVLQIIFDSPSDIILSFTYTIDRYKNVLFSEDAKKSHHINHCDGQPSYGAGEIYFRIYNKAVELLDLDNYCDSQSNHGSGEAYIRRNVREIEVVELNNESGLYVPNKDFLNAMTDWLKEHNFSIKHIRRKDSHDAILNHNVEMRMLLK